MLPILKRLKERKETPQQGLAVQINPTPLKNDSTEAIESCMVHLLGAIAANDPKAMANALINAHDEMHAQMDTNKAEPHSYAAQNIKAGEQY